MVYNGIIYILILNCIALVHYMTFNTVLYANITITSTQGSYIPWKSLNT